MKYENDKYIGYRKWRHISGSYTGEWGTWVQVEPKLLQEIAESTGWKILDEPEYEKGSQWGAYFFTLSKV